MDILNVTQDPNIEKMYAAINLLEQGKVEESHRSFLELLHNQFQSSVVYYFLAKIEAQFNRNDEALSYIDQAIEISPSTADFFLAKSIILLNLGNLDDSRENVNKSLKLNPLLEGAHQQLKTLNNIQTPLKGISEEIDSINAIALDLQSQNKFEESENLFQIVLQKQPDNFVALYSLGMSKINQNDTPSATIFFEALVSKYPKNELALFGLGNCYQSLGNYPKALEIYDLNIEENPYYANSYHNKAAILQTLKQHKNALLALVEASERNPKDYQSLEGQGILLSEFKEYSQSAAIFQKLYELDSDYPLIKGNLLNSKLHNCDWADFDKLTSEILNDVSKNKLACNPLTLMTFCTSAEIALNCAKIFGEKKYPQRNFSLWNGETYNHPKKRICFISGDFREHPVGYLIVGLIESFNREHFETFGIFTGKGDGSNLWKRFCCGFDNFLNCSTKTDLEIAKLIRSLEIDCLIDLSGYTADSRIGLLSFRAAKVQITYLGFPGTLGLPYVDFLIADGNTVPINLQQNYSEKIISLPFNYLPRDNNVTPSEKKFSRSDFGLPEDGFVFCCFNHLYKITPTIFKIWMRLLSETKNSVLWLMEQNNKESKENLYLKAKEFGISEERLIFAKRLPDIRDHLNRFSLADIFLDTYPYNGHTTCSDALRAGLPVITLSGETFASRVGYSLLKDLELEILSSNSENEYFDKALFMASNPQSIYEIKKLLRDKLDSKTWPISQERFTYEFINLISNL